MQRADFDAVSGEVFRRKRHAPREDGMVTRCGLIGLMLHGAAAVRELVG